MLGILLTFLRRENYENTKMICAIIAWPIIIATIYFGLIGTAIASLYMFNGGKYDIKTGECHGGWFCSDNKSGCSSDTGIDLFWNCFLLGIVASVVYIGMLFVAGFLLLVIVCIVEAFWRSIKSEWSKATEEYYQSRAEFIETQNQLELDQNETNTIGANPGNPSEVSV